MSDKKEQPASDAELFRQALEGVTPLAPSGRIPPEKPKPPARVGARPAAAGSAVSRAGDTLSDHGAGEIPLTEFMRNGISRMTLRKLRRGQFPVQDTLDLHGLTTDGARSLLVAFLHESAQHQLRCVGVIHGKGQHAEHGEGKLKALARHWLTQRPEVLAFCEAPQHMGGGGAVWVLLKTHGGSGDGA